MLNSQHLYWTVHNHLPVLVQGICCPLLASEGTCTHTHNKNKSLLLQKINLKKKTLGNIQNFSIFNTVPLPHLLLCVCVWRGTHSRLCWGESQYWRLPCLPLSCVCVFLGIEPGTSHMLGKCSVAELYCQRSHTARLAGQRAPRCLTSSLELDGKTGVCLLADLWLYPLSSLHTCNVIP